MSEPVAWRSYGRMKNDLTGWRFATCSSTYHDDPKQEALYTHPPMKTREEVARFIEQQFHWSHNCSLSKTAHHYGRQEARELMDFIYGEEPQSEAQKIKTVYE